MRWHRIALLLIAMTVFFGHELVAASLPDRSSEHNFRVYPVPHPANDMALKDLTGRMFTLSSLRGRVVILNFWKVECPPCSVEKPILERIFQKYSGSGLEIVAVNLVDSGEQQQAYVRNGRFSFRFAFDPDNRLSLRQQALSQGVSTSFVVNPRQEAIYEVPAVPTTYLIDRSGRVVGNSVGLTNWEQPAMTRLLESLLRPVARSVTTVGGSREDVEGSSPISFASAVNPHPERSGATQGPAVVSQAVETTRLPFQGGPVTRKPDLGTPSASNPSLQAPSAAPSGPAETPATPKGQPKAAAKKKPDAKQPAAARVDYRQPRPYSAPPGGIAKPTLGPSGAGTAPQTAKPLTMEQQPISPATPMSPVQSPLSGSSLPPLPPAMPYSPGPTQSGKPPVVPDQNGSIMARIPPSGRTAAQPGQALPAAQPLSQDNPISGFVLDSFGRTRPSGAGATTVPDPPGQAPASSLWGQLGQDFEQLGSGIRDVFSRLTPAK